MLNWLHCRLNDGFEDVYNDPPTEAPYGEFVLPPGVANGLPYGQYANTKALALPHNLTEVSDFASCQCMISDLYVTCSQADALSYSSCALAS